MAIYNREDPRTALPQLEKQFSEINHELSARDYIVEQKQDGDSFYRKWNSGVAECWIRTTQNVAMNTAYGSLYQGGWTWNLPITFSEYPTALCGMFKWGTGASWGIVSGYTKTSVTLRGIDVVSRANGSCVIMAYAIGRWK